MASATRKPHYEILFCCFYVTLELGLSVFNQSALLLYIPRYHIHISFMANASIIICIISTFFKIGTAYYSDRNNMENSYHNRRAPFLVGSVAAIGFSMIMLASCPFSVGSKWDIPWFLFHLATLFVAQNVMAKMLHLFLWDITETQEEYSNYLLVLEPIGSAVGASIGLMLSLFQKNFLVIACVSAFPSLFILTLILNEYASHRATVSLTPIANLLETIQPPLIPSIRLVIRTKEFRKILFNITCLNLNHAFILVAQTYFLLFGFSYLIHYNSFRQLLIVIHLTLYVFTMVSVIVCRSIISTYEKLHIYRYFCIANCIFAMFMFAFSFHNATFILYLLCMIATGITTLTQISFKYLFVRDLAVLDTFYTGFRREGIYQLAIQLPEGIIATISGAIPQLLLPLTGWKQMFDPSNDDTIRDNYQWTPSTVWLLRIFSSVLIVACSLASFRSLRSYTLSQPMVDSMIQSNRDKLFQGDQCPLLDESFMVMMHLSDVEQVAIVKHSCTCSKTLKAIYFQNRILLVLTLLVLIVLIASAIAQFILDNEALVTLTLIVILIISVFYIYEFLRVEALRNLTGRLEADLYEVAMKALRNTMLLRHHRKASKVGYSPICEEGDIDEAIRDACVSEGDQYMVNYHVSVVILLSLLSYGIISMLLV